MILFILILVINRLIPGIQPFLIYICRKFDGDRTSAFHSLQTSLSFLLIFIKSDLNCGIRDI